jgi:hypothetical protein
MNIIYMALLYALEKVAIHLRAYKMRVVTLPLPYVPAETPNLIGVSAGT